MDEKIVLCGANSYQQKYYFNPQFKALPENIRQELQIISVYISPQPCSLHNNRNGRSVTPAMGAKIRLFSNSTFPIFSFIPDPQYFLPGTPPGRITPGILTIPFFLTGTDGSSSRFQSHQKGNPPLLRIDVYGDGQRESHFV